MTKTELDLARRLAAHSKWKWMAGMRNGVGDRVLFNANAEWIDTDEGLVPLGQMGHVDLADPATQGCLWAMLRGVAVEEDGAEWVVYQLHGGQVVGASKGEALARALLAAWGDE
jgi:hypothetical protein